MQKTCTLCKVTKPIHQFHLDAKNPDGHCHRCAECKSTKKKVKNPFKNYNGKPKVGITCDISSNMGIDISKNMAQQIRDEEKLNLKSYKTTYAFDIKPKKIPIAEEFEDPDEDNPNITTDLNLLFATISAIYQAHFTLSVSREGKAVLNVQSNPSHVFKGTVQEVIDLALA